MDYGIYTTQGKKTLLGNRATVNGRDAIAYVKNGQLQSYTDYKDPDMEANIEEVLTAHELYYEKSEVWIETEKMYEVLYELTV